MKKRKSGKRKEKQENRKSPMDVKQKSPLKGKRALRARAGTKLPWQGTSKSIEPTLRGGKELSSKKSWKGVAVRRGELMGIKGPTRRHARTIAHLSPEGKKDPSHKGEHADVKEEECPRH